MFETRDLHVFSNHGLTISLHSLHFKSYEASEYLCYLTASTNDTIHLTMKSLNI